MRMRVVLILGCAFLGALAPHAPGAPAASLNLNPNSAPYGDWTSTTRTWGDGYPTAVGVFNTEEALQFPDGSQRQKIGSNNLTPGTSDDGPQNDNPAFLAQYPTNLSLAAMIADTGIVSLTWTFSFATELVDIIVCDVDDLDVAAISATDAAGAAVPPSNLQFIMQGDLSLNVNAGGRPPSELATPPTWNPSTGTLTAAVSWNENRSYTVLRPRPGVALKTVTITLDGARPDNDGPSGSGLGSHIYVNLWATPRKFAMKSVARPTVTQTQLSWTSLPGISYQLWRSTDLTGWTQGPTIPGAASPATVTETTVTATGGTEFYKIIQP